LSIVETERAQLARQWLTAHDVVEVDDESVRDVVPRILDDPELDPAGRLDVALGLLELLPIYWITVQLRWYVNGSRDAALQEAFWSAIRSHLEAAVPTEAVLHSLWSDWFSDIDTTERAFAEVIGDDAGRLADGDEALTRRAAAVLKVSGPVPWRIKHPVYAAAADVAQLRPAVFNGVLYSFHDVYGSLQIDPALELLERLELPEETAHLADLRAALREGISNDHHRVG
jgi:hypothetical protein